MTASAKLVLLCAIGVVVLLALAAKMWILPRFRVEKPELERRRRLLVNRRGRLRDAMVTELKDDFLIYSYTIGRVEYTASQDVSSLHDLLPDDPLGPATVKYTPHNPANSIVLCETWSGLRNWHPNVSHHNHERSA